MNLQSSSDKSIDFQVILQSAIDRGTAYLDTCGAHSISHSWTSKTKYSVKFVAESYVLAAYWASQPIVTPEDTGRSLLSTYDLPQMSRYVPLLKRTNLFSSVPDSQLLASLVESSLFIPLLRARRLDVFARDDNRSVSKDHYLNLIPMTWIGCNNLSEVYVPTNFVFDMMVISLLGYQTDEFFEAVATPAFSDNPDSLNSMINDIVSSLLEDDSQNSQMSVLSNVSDMSLEHRKVCTIDSRIFVASSYYNIRLI